MSGIQYHSLFLIFAACAVNSQSHAVGCIAEDAEDSASLLQVDHYRQSDRISERELAERRTSEPEPRIPRQLILTGKPDDIHEMPVDIQSNIANNLRWNLLSIAKRDADAVIKLRWFGDSACHSYISEHFDAELLSMFDNAHPGYYRGDICRAAVLYNEGGFYTDVDVELAISLVELIGANTSFMSVFSINGDIFNGLIAASPKSPIMNNTLQEIRKWYRGESAQTGLMGTMTMFRGMENLVAAECPSANWKDQTRLLEWGCGNENVRLYQESDLFCFPDPGEPQPQECSTVRRDGSFNMRLGFFEPGKVHDWSRVVLGWPRFLSCKDTETACGSGGHTMLIQTERQRARRRLLGQPAI
jgi:hypothetical protein